MSLHPNQPTGAFVSGQLLTKEMKLEIGRMLREGVSIEGIKAVVETWTMQPFSYVSFTEYGQSPVEPVTVVEGTIVEKDDPIADFKAYMEKYHTWPVSVEGSIVEPITDETRLLD